VQIQLLREKKGRPLFADQIEYMQGVCIIVITEECRGKRRRVSGKLGETQEGQCPEEDLGKNSQGFAWLQISVEGGGNLVGRDKSLQTEKSRGTTTAG